MSESELQKTQFALANSQAEVNVHKFGGSSLATADCIERVVAIIADNAGLTDYIVVSANGDTTDSLFSLLALASDDEQTLGAEPQHFESALAELQQAQTVLIEQLIHPDHCQRLLTLLGQDIEQISHWA